MEQISNGDAEEITSWVDMKKALQGHFSPEYDTLDARTRIKYMKETRSLHSYQWEFSSAILELPDMEEKENVFNFIIGLKPWA